jgi:response regulator of citrate/malate metabolism
VIDVLVVDDDFRVAQVHTTIVDGVDGVRCAGMARDAAETLRLVSRLRPDLVLLDNYLPDLPGVELARGLEADVFIVTADTSAASVRAALAAGALQYLIKPFAAEQLRDRLRAYARYRTRLAAGPDLTQDGVDRLFATLREADRPPPPKGQSTATARLVRQALQRADVPRSASDVADELGIARATAQRYLATLADDGKAMMSLRYGSTGRPEHEYRWSGR